MVETEINVRFTEDEQIEQMQRYQDTLLVISDVINERQRQRMKFPKQEKEPPPSGTGALALLAWPTTANAAREETEEALAAGEVTMTDILREEVCEALEETEHSRLRQELIQVAAVAIQWCEHIDRAAAGKVKFDVA